MTGRLEKITAGGAGAALVLALWQLLSMSAAGNFLPDPLSVVIWTLKNFRRVLLPHAAFSLMRIAVSVLVSSAAAYPAGVYSALSEKAGWFISGISYILYPVPKIALLPLFLILLGLGELSRILIVVAVIFFQVLISVRDSVKAIEKEYFTAVSVLGGKKMHVFRYVIWPCTLPGFISSIRVSSATSLSVLFFAETFATDRGLGFFIMDSWIRVAYIEMMAGILCISLLGIAFFSLLDYAEKKLCSWRGHG